MDIDVTVQVNELHEIRTRTYRRAFAVLNESYEGVGYGVNVGDSVLVWLPRSDRERGLVIDRLTAALESLRAPALNNPQATLYESFRQEVGSDAD